MLNGNEGAPNRRWIATPTFVVLFPLGGVYGRSAFVEPLQEEFDWTWTQSMAPLMASMAFIVFGSLAISQLREVTGTFAAPLGVFAGLSLLTIGLSAVVKPPGDRKVGEEREVTAGSEAQAAAC